MVSITIDQKKCSLCRICTQACPNEIYTVKLQGIEVDKDKCLGCGNCITMCPIEDFGEKPIYKLHNGKLVLTSLEKCKRFDESGWYCKLCIDVCPVGAIRFVGNCQLREENIQNCLEADGKDCRICSEACPEGAIRVRRDDGKQ
jgi:NAD-dependent dihydropyrimidine dehydrogenase PreA subunit